MSKIQPAGWALILSLFVIISCFTVYVVRIVSPPKSQIYINYSSEKTGFFEDVNFQRIAAKNNFVINSVSKVVENTDVFFPATPGKDKDVKIPISSVDSVFSSRLVLAVGKDVYPILKNKGYIGSKDGHMYLQKPSSFISEMMNGTMWVHSNINGKSFIQFPYPKTSSAGRLATYWILSQLSPDGIINQSSFENYSVLIRNNFLSTNKYKDSLDLLKGFESDPDSSIIFTYQSLVQEKLSQGKLSGVKIVYCNPTLPVKHPIYAYTEKGQSFIKFLTSNPEVGQLAWEKYGLLPQENKDSYKVPENLKISGIVPEIQSKMLAPSSDTLQLMENVYVGVNL